MYNKILAALIFLAAALIIVWLYNVNDLIQYDICSSKPTDQLSQTCKDILYGK